MRSASTVPIYGTRDVYMGFGVLGGVITTGPVQGSLTADLALRILRGESVDSIPVVKTLPDILYVRSNGTATIQHQYLTIFRRRAKSSISPSSPSPI